MLMLTDGPPPFAGGRAWDPQGNRATPPLPGAGLMTILRPALRALDARLHALRAECKAANMKHAGNIPGEQGEDRVPRQHLQPLDQLITEVIQRLDVAGKALRPPGSPAPLPPTNVLRQRDLMPPLDDGRDRSALQNRSRDQGRSNGWGGRGGRVEPSDAALRTASPNQLAFLTQEDDNPE